MDAASGLLQLLGLFAVLVGLGAVVLAPELLAGMAQARRDDWEREVARQAELERKLAIAEAANAARRRGETFVPPADYDR